MQLVQIVSVSLEATDLTEGVGGGDMKLVDYIVQWEVVVERPAHRCFDC